MSSFLGSFADKMGALLVADGFPLIQSNVIFGREGFTRETEAGPYVQVLTDPAGDAFEAGTAQQGNATTLVKFCGVLVHFQASSPKAGASEDDHIEAIDALTDAFAFHLVALSHHARCRLRNVKSSEVEIVLDAAQPCARVDMQFQIGRGVNRPDPVVAGAAILPKQQVIVTGPVIDGEVVDMLTGSAASVLDASPAATIGGLADVDDSMAGFNIVISGAATLSNNGTFRILSVIDATSVTIQNPDAVSPDANDGAIVWSIVRSETAVPGV